MQMSAAVPSKSVLAWLASLYALVLTMVVVGGVTRLTGSGLSMVVWQPLIGIVPPLDEADWNATFDLYKQTPQYLQVNHWMTVDDFKRIFLWEYVHRVLGRLIGVVTLVPWLYFVARGRLRGRWAISTLLAFVFGGLQGALGWFMVKSGLVDVPEVSHLRLAAHLLLAFFVGHWFLWILLDASRPRLIAARGTKVSRAAWAVAALIVVQIVYGAFMAGTRAGHLYATFPDMNGAWTFPRGAFSMAPAWLNLVENPVAIHAVHRWLAWGVVVATTAFAVWGLRQTSDRDTRRAVTWLVAVVAAQVTLGALTVLTHVNIILAVMHQAVGFLLLSSCITVAHRARTARALL